jgi:YidC/Oxa1 family membrane protein insertase
LLSALLLASAAGAAPLPKQTGLPAELVISGQPPLAEQAKVLENPLASYVKASAPKSGLLDKLGGFFTGGKKVPLIGLAQLPAAAVQFKGQPTPIAVQGVFQAGPDPNVASFSSRGVSCVLSLGPAVVRAGLPTGSLAGLPIRAEGLAQVAPNGVVTLQVARLLPGGSLVDLRLGRVHELQGDYAGALATYEEAASLAQGEGYEFAAFAQIRAAELTLNQLKDDKAAQKLYAAAWQFYTKRDKGQAVYNTWVQTSAGDWKAAAVSEVIADPLKKLNETGFWYKLVQGFVTVCGGTANPYSAGLGLLLLALATRLLVWPLTKKQLASARDMQRLQPMMKALQAKHKDDKQKFQEEFWKLCQEHGVNPLGGCLPMIVQMPLLWLVYAGVRAYIVNLDHSTFLWVHSLAQPDLWLLGLYTVSQIAFGKVTQGQNPAAAADPAQKQQQQMMTYMMPVMFFFLFQSFPAAFMLYWLGTNLVYLGQQLLYNRMAPPLDTPLVPKPAGGGGGFFAKMMSSAGKPPEKEQPPSDQSYDARKAISEGKMTSKEDAKARRKKKRWKKPQ